MIQAPCNKIKKNSASEHLQTLFPLCIHAAAQETPKSVLHVQNEIGTTSITVGLLTKILCAYKQFLTVKMVTRHRKPVPASVFLLLKL